MCDLSKVGAVVSANLSLGAISGFVGHLDKVVNILIGFGQLAVAVVTVLYIVKKMKQLKKGK